MEMLDFRIFYVTLMYVQLEVHSGLSLEKILTEL